MMTFTHSKAFAVMPRSFLLATVSGASVGGARRDGVCADVAADCTDRFSSALESRTSHRSAPEVLELNVDAQDLRDGLK